MLCFDVDDKSPHFLFFFKSPPPYIAFFRSSSWKPPDDLTIRMPGGLLGVDKAGRPALYFCACHVDFDNLTGDEIEKIEIRKQQQINVALRDSRYDFHSSTCILHTLCYVDCSEKLTLFFLFLFFLLRFLLDIQGAQHYLHCEC